MTAHRFSRASHDQWRAKGFVSPAHQPPLVGARNQRTLSRSAWFVLGILTGTLMCLALGCTPW